MSVCHMKIILIHNYYIIFEPRIIEENEWGSYDSVSDIYPKNCLVFPFAAVVKRYTTKSYMQRKERVNVRQVRKSDINW